MTILPHRRLSVMPLDQALSAIADTVRLVTIVTVGLVVVLGLGIYYRGPRFAAEMQALYQKLGPLIASLQTLQGGTPWSAPLRVDRMGDLN